MRSNPSSVSTIYVSLDMPNTNHIIYKPQSHLEAPSMFLKMRKVKPKESPMIPKIIFENMRTLDMSDTESIQLNQGSIAIIHGNLNHCVKPHEGPQRYYIMSLLEGRGTKWEEDNIFHRSESLPLRIMDRVNVTPE